MKMIEPSIRALRLLEALGDGSGLVRAAHRLAMSQSGASHTLAGLEKTIGAPLVVRDGSGLKLSETGRRVLPHVRQVLTSLEAMREEVSGLAGLQNGALRIAAVPSVAGAFLPRLIREFNTRFPGVEVSLFEGTDNEVAEWVSNRMVHVGFAALPVDGLQGEEITRDEWLALAVSDDFSGRDKVTLRALAQRRFLLSGGGCEVHIRRLFEDAGLDLPSHLSVKQVSTIQSMVAEGLGVSLVPSMALGRNIKGIRALRLSPRQYRAIGLLQPPGAFETPVLRAWTDLVRSHFPAGHPSAKAMPSTGAHLVQRTGVKNRSKLQAPAQSGSMTRRPRASERVRAGVPLAVTRQSGS